MPNNLTLPAKLREIANLCPQQIFARVINHHGVSELSYHDFYQCAVKVAYFLQSIGIQPNDKIAIVLENCGEWGSIYFGILLSGAIAVPLDAQSSIHDLTFFCHDAGCRAAFVGHNFISKMEQATASLEQFKTIIKVETPYRASLQREPLKFCLKAEAPSKETPCRASLRQIISFKEIDKVVVVRPFPQRSADDIASILYTSGTTGNYKGVMLTHRNFLANFTSIMQLKIPLNKNHFLALLPLHHAFPFMVTLIVPLFTQGKVTYLNNLQSDVLLNCLRQDVITIFPGVPQLFYMLHKSIAAKINNLNWLIKMPLLLLREVAWWLRKTTKINCSKWIFRKIHRSFGKQLKFLLSGGAKLDDDLARFFLKLGFNLVEGYGLTETSPVATFNFNKLHKLQSVGKAIPGVEIKIASSTPTSKKQITTGEIMIRGNNVMLGYYQHEAATQEVIKDGWFYSGDLGYLDRQGYLYITGRQKEIIALSSGKKISPEELEAYYSRTKLIKEICLTLGGSKTEEKLMAIIVPDLEYCRQIGTVDIYGNIKESLELLSAQLPPYQRIMGMIITKEPLPRTQLGKLRRFIIKEKYAAELAGTAAITKSATKNDINEHDLALLAQPLTQQIFKILANFVGAEKTINLDDHLEMDLGIDSLLRAELMLAIEKNQSIKITTMDFSKVASVRELVMLVMSLTTPSEHSTINIANQPLAEITWADILAQDLPPVVQRNIVVKFNFFQKIIFMVGMGLLKLLLRLFWRLKVRGIENLPRNQAFILCPNHTSFLDGFAVAASLPNALRKKTFFIGLKEFFAIPIWQKVAKAIPIDPGTELVTAMQAAAYVLRNNQVVCIFPEGARSADGTIKDFKKGVGILAVELNVPLVPVYISGAYESLPRSARLPKLHKIMVTFGKPYAADELQTPMSDVIEKDKYATIAQNIRQKVIEIMNYK